MRDLITAALKPEQGRKRQPEALTIHHQTAGRGSISPWACCRRKALQCAIGISVETTIRSFHTSAQKNSEDVNRRHRMLPDLPRHTRALLLCLDDELAFSVRGGGGGGWGGGPNT